ncbi:MAG: (2Fe-2S)-binding protein [Acidimicrobiales bacterium]
MLEALRDELGVRSVKDGCSPQGQCGCCTVLVDGTPRVSCVTAVRRVAGRAVTTVEGLDPDALEPLVAAMLAHGASQCGFCTPGILCRLVGLGPRPSPAQVDQALLAHLCRCTGWRTIADAALDPRRTDPVPADPVPADPVPARSQAGADRRATLEGGVSQRGGRRFALGQAGFADDGAPPDCLVAVPDRNGGWAVGETLAEARAAAGAVPGRRRGQDLAYPMEVPPGEWAATLQTTWVEPAYLEPDASWCRPGGEPASPAANGGAFGAKMSSPAPAAARELADRHGRAVRVLLSREDVVRLGPKRPPVAGGIAPDGTGRLRIARLDLVKAIAGVAPGLEVETVDVCGPPVSERIRAAGWAEAAVLVAAAAALLAGRVGPPSGEATVVAPGGGRGGARVAVDELGLPSGVEVDVDGGDPLDEVTLRSYATGAAHMALGWVCSEAIAVDGEGTPTDLTIRSFGVLRARDTPPITVRVTPGGRPAVPASDAVFAAVAAATWIAQGLPPRWPTRRERFR